MFNEQLKKARLNAGLTQQQLGETINTDKRMVSKFEGGYCLPTAKDLDIICKILKTTPQKLHFPSVATSKIKVATKTKQKSSIDTYKLTVELNRGDFSKLTKSNLKKCGYNNLKEFISMAYEQLENQLQILELEQKQIRR